MNNATAGAALLFLQLTVILTTCRICGLLMRRIGQSPVIGEMVAGVLLGPSLLGAVAPATAEWIFPASGKTALFAIAQVGLTLYMFIIGLEFRMDLLRTNWKNALSVSLAGILTPFVLGASLAIWMAGQEGFFTSGISPLMAMLFMGAAMSITAFPMLARIILEHGLAGTKVGTIGLAAGSIDDVVAWILLAAVLGAMSGSPLLLMMALGGGAFYTLVCLKFMPRVWVWLEAHFDDRTVLGLVALFLMLGGWFTDLIGLYSVFGAFILGLSVPRDGLAQKTAGRTGPLTTALLVPVFFAYSGLNTSIGLLDSWMLWGVCALVILVAVSGKFFACYAAARFSGSSRPDALMIGSLMNARGLMELILLNIVLEAGLISQTLFTMLVVMAIITTLMAAPGFNLARRLAPSGC